VSRVLFFAQDCAMRLFVESAVIIMEHGTGSRDKIWPRWSRSLLHSELLW
jgi:hypothetical protein